MVTVGGSCCVDLVSDNVACEVKIVIHDTQHRVLGRTLLDPANHYGSLEAQVLV